MRGREKDMNSRKKEGKKEEKKEGRKEGRKGRKEVTSSYNNRLSHVLRAQALIEVRSLFGLNSTVK